MKLISFLIYICLQLVYKKFINSLKLIKLRKYLKIIYFYMNYKFYYIIQMFTHIKLYTNFILKIEIKIFRNFLKMIKYIRSLPWFVVLRIITSPRLSGRWLRLSPMRLRYADDKF